MHVFAPFLLDFGIVAVLWREFYTVPVLIRFCLPPQDTSNRRRLIKQSALEREYRAWSLFGKLSRRGRVFSGVALGLTFLGILAISLCTDYDVTVLIIVFPRGLGSLLSIEPMSDDSGTMVVVCPFLRTLDTGLAWLI